MESKKETRLPENVVEIRPGVLDQSHPLIEKVHSNYPQFWVGVDSGIRWSLAAGAVIAGGISLFADSPFTFAHLPELGQISAKVFFGSVGLFGAYEVIKLLTSKTLEQLGRFQQTLINHHYP